MLRKFLLSGSLCLASVFLHATTLSDVLPLSLPEVEALALENNKAVRALRERLAAQESAYRSSRAKNFPSLSYSGSISETQTGVNKDFKGSFTSAFRLSQPLYDSTSFHNADIAQLNALIARWNLADLENDVLFDVRRAYYAVVLTQGQLQVRKENIELLAEAANREARKQELGEATLFDVQQSQVSVANALSEYYRANRDLNNAKNALVALLGEDAGYVDVLELMDKEISVLSVRFLADKLETLGILESDDKGVEISRLLSDEAKVQKALGKEIFTSEEMQQWEEVGLKYQPRIHRELVQVELAKKNLSKGYGDYKPDVNLFGTYNVNGQGAPKNSGAAGVSFSWDLFDSFSREHNISSLKSSLKQSEVDLSRVRQETKANIYDRFYDLEEAMLSYFSADQSVGLAEQAIEQARNRRDFGVITPLEYRDAANALTEARQNLNQASFDLLRSYYALWQSVGLAGHP